MGNNSSTMTEHKSSYSNEFNQSEKDENYRKTTTRTSNDNSQTSSLYGCGTVKQADAECCANSKAMKNENGIVIALDFGTTYTGFAYSYQKNRSSIETGKRVLGEDRVPTVVLLKPDKTIEAIGGKAKYRYAQLLLRKNHKGYRLFSRFKMALYAKDAIKRDATVPDNDGITMPALELFTIVIRYMVENALSMVKDSLAGDKENIKDTILWILTIPAIWSDSARQFMHEVFVNAGIAEKQLRLVLEPEAAAIYCRSDVLHRSENFKIGKLPVGSKYILADLGGGTVDICSHEIMENNRIREIFRATGGAYGGTFVDGQFIQTLIKIFGLDVFRTFQRVNFYDYLTLVDEFEKNKRSFGPESNTITDTVVTVPYSLERLFEDTTQCCIEDIIRQGPYSESIRFCFGKLIFNRQLMEEFFSESVKGIIMCLQKIVNQCKDEHIGSILLVGGYAESKYVFNEITKSMEEFEVILVSEPRLSVMKGAVMLGYEDRKIVQRKSRVTYGFACAKPFIEGVHPEKYKFERDGEYWCGSIFDKLIEKDQYVEYGQEFKTTTSTPRRLQKSKTQNVYVTVVISEKRYPVYCSEDEECKEVGEIIIKPPEGGWPDENEKEMYLIVQEDIMLCKVIDKSCGGKEYTTKVDFLSKSIKL